MSRRPRSAGQAVVEFALIIPIFLTLLLGIVDFGRVVWASNSLASAAREGARFAIVHGAHGSPSGSPQAVKDVVLSSALAGGTSIQVTVCYGVGCSGDSNAAGATDTRGTPVTVAVSSQLPLIVPSLLGFSTFGVSGNSTMLVNY